MNNQSTPRFSARKKNHDNMLLLISDPDFKQEVADIRQRFKIPPDGFKSDSDHSAWQAKTASDYAKLTDAEKRDTSAFMKFIRMPIMFAEKYHLPEHYSVHIQMFIAFGTISAPLLNFDVGPFPVDVDPRQARHIPIRIFAPLTNDDLADLKKVSNNLSKHLPSYKPLKNIKGKIASEKKIAERDAQNSAWDHSGRPFSLAEMAEGKKKKVYADIRELKDLRKKRFGK